MDPRAPTPAATVTSLKKKHTHFVVVSFSGDNLTIRILIEAIFSRYDHDDKLYGLSALQITKVSVIISR